MKDRQRVEADGGKVGLHGALDATVEDARVDVRTDGTNHDVMLAATLVHDAGNAYREVTVDLFEGGLGAGLVDGGTLSAHDDVGSPIIRIRSAEVGPPRGDDRGEGRISTKLFDYGRADQARRSKDKDGHCVIRRVTDSVKGPLAMSNR